MNYNDCGWMIMMMQMIFEFVVLITFLPPLKCFRAYKRIFSPSEWVKTLNLFYSFVDFFRFALDFARNDKSGKAIKLEAVFLFCFSFRIITMTMKIIKQCNRTNSQKCITIINIMFLLCVLRESWWNRKVFFCKCVWNQCLLCFK